LRRDLSQGGLRKAHVWNQERTRLECERRSPLIVIDNCLLTVHDAAPYAALARQHGYQLNIVDVEQGVFTDAELAARNVHGVPQETIAELRTRYERYTVADLMQQLKRAEPGDDSKETLALRKKYRDNLLERAAALQLAAADELPAAASATSALSTKVRIEVCRNDGQANPCKPMVVGAADTLRSVTEAACKKLGLTFRLFALCPLCVSGSLQFHCFCCANACPEWSIRACADVCVSVSVHACLRPLFWMCLLFHGKKADERPMRVSCVPFSACVPCSTARKLMRAVNR
jgi:hypothetical protein